MALSSCANMIHQIKVSMNKEKYEKELQYKEGQILTLTSNTSEWRLINGTIYMGNGSVFVDSNKNETRYAQTGQVRRIIKYITFPSFPIIPENDKWDGEEYKMSNFKNDFEKVTFQAEITHLERKCKFSEFNSSKCIEPFTDELKFVVWADKGINSKIKKMAKLRNKKLGKLNAQSARRNYRHSPAYIRKKNPQLAKSCDSILKSLGDNLSKTITKRKAKKALKIMNDAAICSSQSIYTKSQKRQFDKYLYCIERLGTPLQNDACK